MKDTEQSRYVNDQLPGLIGGASGILLAIGYVIIIALYAPIGAPPVSTDGLLRYLGAHPARWDWIVTLSVLTDFLFLPLAASIYFAVKSVDRYIAWLAAGCIVLFVVLDLSITWTNYTAAIALGGEYLKAATNLQRSAVLSTAEPLNAVLHSKLLFVYNSLTLAVGILMDGFLMLRSTFGRVAAYLGVAAGLAGILAVIGSFFTSGLGFVIILASCLTAVWTFVVGCLFLRRAARVRSAG